ncbi:MAG: hypothetical protein OEY58_19335 [Gammaproteobacteria bacterium]|nr:hypothetical protein [Gammaproteobacteria bacterium]
MASKMIGIRFKETEYEELVQVATNSGVTPTEYLRSLYYERKEHDDIMIKINTRLRQMELSILQKIRDEISALKIEVIDD